MADEQNEPFGLAVNRANLFKEQSRIVIPGR